MNRMSNEVIIPEVVSQHAEEAAFLWMLRHEAAQAPHYSLVTLTKLDDRIEAHLDGLRIASEAGWAICKKGSTGRKLGKSLQQLS